MAGCHDKDFDHTPNHPITDALGRDLIIGDTIAHITKVASRTRVTKRTILEMDRVKGTMTISPTNDSVRFGTTKPGKNVKGANVLRL